MSERIVLTDLAAPRFAAPVREVLDLVAATGRSASFDPDDLMSAAVAETGLDDFGDPWFHEPLGVLCAALEAEAPTS